MDFVSLNVLQQLLHLLLAILVMGHKYATGLITRAQKLVTFFRASHQPLALLNKLAGNMGIKRMLITSNKTRFTSVHASLESVVRLQSALQEIARQQASLLSKEALNIINDDMFFVRLEQICRLLEPFILVIAAVQAARTTLAYVMCYWLHLAKSVTGSSSDCLPPAFKAHFFVAYNLRHQEMVSPLCKLALFLHPLYRDVALNDKKNWVEVQMTAGNMWKSGYCWVVEIQIYSATCLTHKVVVLLLLDISCSIPFKQLYQLCS